ncbi:alpha/beta fold hydrolase [Algoriphagus chordae]|nr:alpha/beta hydrolase [Algoriphagus chordae]
MCGLWERAKNFVSCKEAFTFFIPMSHGYALEKAIPGSKLVFFDDTGHVPMEEIPTASVAKYLSFLGVEVRKDYFHEP